MQEPPPSTFPGLSAFHYIYIYNESNIFFIFIFILLLVKKKIWVPPAFRFCFCTIVQKKRWRWGGGCKGIPPPPFSIAPLPFQTITRVVVMKRGAMVDIQHPFFQ
nr:hypothetical protein [Morchella crassipes]